MYPKILTAIAIALLLQACSTQQHLYYWGDYQSLVYEIYHEPGSADPQTQIYRLNLTIERAENYGMKVAPGIYAHLGMVYAQVGNVDLAREALLQEKALYPESATFIDGILSRSNLPISNEEESQHSVGEVGI